MIIGDTIRNGIPMQVYFAQVENNVDPLELGRVQARVYGLHSELKSEDKYEGNKTEHLPWFERVGPAFGSSMTGHGFWGDPPLPGSVIFVFYMEPKSCERGFYFGTYAAIAPQVAPTGQAGFEDPNGEWPRSDRLGQPDPSFHLSESLSKKGESYLDVRKELAESDGLEDIGSALGGPEFSEEGSDGQPRSERNFTYESLPRDPVSTDITQRHGTVIEVDATKSRERVITHHRSGTYSEVRSDGSVQEKTRGDRSEFTTGDKKEYTKGFNTVVIDGESYLLVKSETFEEFKASVKQEIAEELEQKIGTKKTTEVPTEIHKIGKKHCLQSAGDSVKVNDYIICPLTGLSHATANKKVFVV